MFFSLAKITYCYLLQARREDIYSRDPSFDDRDLIAIVIFSYKLYRINDTLNNFDKEDKGWLKIFTVKY